MAANFNQALALATIATLTAVSAEFTGGISRTVLYWVRRFPDTTKRSSVSPWNGRLDRKSQRLHPNATCPLNSSITGSEPTDLFSGKPAKRLIELGDNE